MTKPLRPYQEQAIRSIYNAWASNERPLLVMPPGAGKSYTFMTIARQVSEVYRVVLAVRKRDLVEQLVEDAEKFQLDYGVYMAGHPKFRPRARVQICSIDTLRARQTYPFEDQNKVVVFIDEADESLSKGFCDFIAAYPQAKLGGMTGTPYNGLYHFNKLVMPITAKELRDQGVLVDFKYFVPRSAIKTDDIEISKGQFNQKQVSEKTTAIVGDCIEAWLTYGEYRPTLVFAPTVEHSMGIAYRFNGAGIPAAHCDANTPKAERERIKSDFRAGRIKVITNVGLFCRGTNIVEIGTIIDAAPTLSMNRHEQKMGRGSRQNPYFKDCIYIDMASNVLNLGHYYMDRSNMIDLSRPKRLNRTELESRELMRACKYCFGCFEPSDFKDSKCPRCGEENKVERKVKTAKGDFQEMSPEQIEEQTILKQFRKLWWQYKNLPHFKEKYKGNGKLIRAVILKKLDAQYGKKVYRIVRVR